MNSKERVLLTLAHEEPDRVAKYDAFWVDTLIRWREEGLLEQVTPEDYFDFDIRSMGIDASPRFEPELIKEEGDMIILKDRFGYVVEKSKTKSRTMHFISHPVKNRDDWDQVKKRFVMTDTEPARIDEEAFPFRLDMGPTWEQARKRFQALREKDVYLLGSAYGPHEAILRLRGFEKTLYDVVDHPDLLADMAIGYSDFLIKVIHRCLKERIHIDAFFMIEDLASTKGMLFSPRQWREIFKPSVEKIGSFLRENKLDFWMHSCGNGEEVFYDLIECGVQVLNPLEAKSGLDVRELKKKYGNHLTFLGNIDVRAMAESEAAVAFEMREKITVAKKCGGYIYHSDHSVPPEVSLQRYRYVMNVLEKYGAYKNKRSVSCP